MALFMCGIVGIINPTRKSAIQNMAKAIYHRGPDDAGFFVDEYVALGVRRLSVIDLVGGKQPISSNDGRFTIIFNGEIYNYKELKSELGDYKFKTDSDTEVVLVGFLKWGTEILPRLRGMFAFSIYDAKEKQIFLARDFFGIKPLYYLIDDMRSDVIAFSSEIKSFLTLPAFKPEVNDQAIFNYLSFQYNPLEETFFKSIFKLPPAHFMKIDINTKKTEMKRYWQFEFKPDNSLDEVKTAKEVLEVMEDSVSHHLIADVTIGSFLSGGIDSSIIATLMKKIRGENPPSRKASGGQRKIKTFTVGFESLSEGREALETVNLLDTDHREITIGAQEYFENLPKAIWHFDEPVADPPALGLYFLARGAVKQVRWYFQARVRMSCLAVTIFILNRLLGGGLLGYPMLFRNLSLICHLISGARIMPKEQVKNLKIGISATLPYLAKRKSSCFGKENQRKSFSSKICIKKSPTLAIRPRCNTLTFILGLSGIS